MLISTKSILQLVEALITYSACIIHDSRATENANDEFLDTMEDYFSLDQDVLSKDERPNHHYQAGVTLENTETPKCHSFTPCQEVIAALDPAERPVSTNSSDPKARFFHRLGINDPESTFDPIPNVTPEIYKETWENDMNRWGSMIKSGSDTAMEMLAVGFGLESNYFIKRGKFGPHLLAPTATKLKGKQVGDVFAGFHTDLNALSVHGRSRYPGLHIWARSTGKKLIVSVPPACLLVQVSKQLEHISNGLLIAGYHEVVCTDKTLAALNSRSLDPITAHRPQIRISSTCFWHFSMDTVLEPKKFIAKLREIGYDEQKLNALERERTTVYQEGWKVGDLVQDELKAIRLDTSV